MVCIFCEELVVKKSVEHVFPRWLLQELDITLAQVEQAQYSHEKGGFISKRKHKLNKLVEGRVCRSCNTGWMSNLESNAKPLLIELFYGRRNVAILNPEERELISVWVIKTALMLNSSSNFTFKIPEEHYKLFFKEQTPFANLLVVGQQHDNTGKFYWIQGSTWQIENEHGYEVTEKDLSKLGSRSYKITLQFEKLLLCIAYWDDPNWQYSLWWDIHIPIWPLSGPVAWSQIPKLFPWNDSVGAVMAFHATLGLIAPQSLPKGFIIKR